MSANNTNRELFNPVGITPAVKEAIRLGIPKEFHEKIRIGGLVALESIKTIPTNIKNCYMELEVLYEPKTYRIDYETRIRVTGEKLNADLIEPDPIYKPLDELFKNISKTDYQKDTRINSLKLIESVNPFGSLNVLEEV